MSRLRVAVIGAGHLGKIHARILSQLPQWELTAVVDPIPAGRDQVAQEYNVLALENHRQLLGKVDAVVIATPTRYHHQVGLDLVSTGMHLFVEKPLAPNSTEARELNDVAQGNGLVLQVGHVERFNPAWNAALPYIQQPKYIEASRCGLFSFRSTDIGVILDLMIHDLDLVLSLNPTPVSGVQALGISLLGQYEDAANVRMTFEDGCVASLNASRISPAPKRLMQVWNAKRFTQIDFAAKSAAIVSPHEKLLRHEVDVESLSAEERNLLKDQLFQSYLPTESLPVVEQDAITQELLDFEQSIRQGTRPKVDGQQALRTILVAEQILQAIQEHAWDGTPQGALGPLGLNSSSVIPSPHWSNVSKAVFQSPLR